MKHDQAAYQAASLSGRARVRGSAARRARARRRRLLREERLDACREQVADPLAVVGQPALAAAGGRLIRRGLRRAVLAVQQEGQLPGQG